MKKILLTLVLALVAVAGFSQASFNVRVGMSMNNYAKADGADMRVSYIAGLGFDYAITDMWSFQSGLMFAGKGAKAGDNVKFKPNYLDIPLMAALKLPIVDDVKFVINAGPYLSVGLAGKYKVGDYSTDFFGDIDNKDNKLIPGKAKRFDTGLQYGVGAEFGNILLNLNGQYGFVSPWKNGDSKNLNFYLTLGYKF